MTDAFSQMLGWLCGAEAWALGNLAIGGVGLAAVAAYRRATTPRAPVAEPAVSIFEEDPESALNTDEPTRDLSPGMRRVPYRGPGA